MRTGIGRDFNDNKNNILCGYGFINSENYIANSDLKYSLNEHRIFQQFTSKQNIGHVSMNHRYRFEQRFIESDFKMRIRYFLGLAIPLTNKEEKTNSIYLSAYNEIFINTSANLFDRNRIYGGIGYKINPKIRFEIGYMNPAIVINSVYLASSIFKEYLRLLTSSYN